MFCYGLQSCLCTWPLHVRAPGAAPVPLATCGTTPRKCVKNEILNFLLFVVNLCSWITEESSLKVLRRYAKE